MTTEWRYDFVPAAFKSRFLAQTPEGVWHRADGKYLFVGIGPAASHPLVLELYAGILDGRRGVKPKLPGIKIVVTVGKLQKGGGYAPATYDHYARGAQQSLAGWKAWMGGGWSSGGSFW